MRQVNKTVTQQIGDEFKEWQVGENIILDMAMGRGKTFFIVNVLGEYAEQEDKKILYLCNRSKLADEVYSDLIKIWTKNITIKTYQSVQTMIENNENLDVFDYIVCDEVHYLFKDAWNDKTDIMYKWLKNNKIMVKIFMSATGHNVFPCIKRWGGYREYVLEPDYSYIQRVVFYDNDKYIDKVIQQLKPGEKVIYFSRKIDSAYTVYDRYSDDASFICSKHTKHKEYKKYISNDALENGNLKRRITCTTSVWDNGINIKDDSLKHIICDMEDLITLIQAIGRKRVGTITKDGFVLCDNDDITLHIRNWNKKSITQFLNPKIATHNAATKYVNDDAEWIQEQQQKRGKRINDCLYVDYETSEIKMNQLRYIGLEKEIYRLEYAKKHGFDKYLIKGLGESFVGEVEYVSIEDEEKHANTNKLSTHLNKMVGTKLFKDQQSEIIEIVGLKDARGRIQKSIGLISTYIQENFPEYILEAKKSNGKRYWMLYRKIAE